MVTKKSGVFAAPFQTNTFSVICSSHYLSLHPMKSAAAFKNLHHLVKGPKMCYQTSEWIALGALSELGAFLAEVAWLKLENIINALMHRWCYLENTKLREKSRTLPFKPELQIFSVMETSEFSFQNNKEPFRLSRGPAPPNSTLQDSKLNPPWMMAVLLPQWKEPQKKRQPFEPFHSRSKGFHLLPHTPHPHAMHAQNCGEARLKLETGWSI